MTLKHESAVGHVTGRAIYTDELLEPRGLVSLWPVQSPHAHARIRGVDAAEARTMPGVHAVLTAKDVPGENETGPIRHDEPLMPAEIVEFLPRPSLGRVVRRQVNFVAGQQKTALTRLRRAKVIAQIHSDDLDRALPG